MIEITSISPKVNEKTALPMLDINLTLDVEAYQDAMCLNGKEATFEAVVAELMAQLQNHE